MSWLKRLFSRRRFYGELSEEIREHIEEKIEELVAGGISRKELLSYAVARRINEIGVRMALGATRTDVSRMVLSEALRMVCAGLLIGAPIAFWAKTFATHLIHDLPAKTVASIAFGAAAMIAVALLAAYVPARRASRIDPL